jgi:large subunit ribosomal protein L9
MKVLLLKDVYKLGRAGDIKRVADGYGRNYLIPQGMAVLATAGAVKQAEGIRSRATAQRTALNQELGGVADRIKGLVIGFPVRAGETGKLYGSVTTQMIADEITRKSGAKVDRRQVECEPIRVLGEHKCTIRLTVDLTPEVKVIVHREGETPAALAAEQAAAAEKTAEAEQTAEEAEAATPEATGEETEAPTETTEEPEA